MITDNVKYEEYLGTMGYNLKQFTNRELDYLVFNTKDAILAQKEIRQAINYAIDRNKINYAIYNNKYKVCNFPLDYGNYLYNLNHY